MSTDTSNFDIHKNIISKIKVVRDYNF